MSFSYIVHLILTITLVGRCQYYSESTTEETDFAVVKPLDL